MITGGCTGSGIGMPQRIRAITWNRTHINYTECVKSERVGIRYVLRKATQSLRFSSVVPACGNDWTTVFMIHKRELSDSMIESVSSLFYLLHCSAHDRLNTMTFRSFRNIPHGLHPERRAAYSRWSTLPQHIPHGLYPETASGKRRHGPLPQHIPHGLHHSLAFWSFLYFSFASAHPAWIASSDD